MNIEKNREKMQVLNIEIKNMGKLKILKNKLFDCYEYNKYLEKVREYNIRYILDKYYNGSELTSDETESIEKYVFFSQPFYLGQADGPSLFDLRLQSSFGSGKFDQEELAAIYKIKNDQRQNNKIIKKNLSNLFDKK